MVKKSGVADPADDDWQSTYQGQRTYRVPEGRPQWAQPVQLILPIISPRDDDLIHDSGSADYRAAEADERSKNVVTDSSSSRPDSAKCGTDSDPLMQAVRNSNNVDYETAEESDGQMNSVVPHNGMRIHRSDVADCTVPSREVMVGVPRLNPTIRESETASIHNVNGAERHFTQSRHHDRASRKPNKERVSDHTHTKRASDIQPGRLPNTRGFQTTTNHRSRGSSLDSSQKTDENRVGSTRRVSLRNGDRTRKWSVDGTATEKRRILTEVNRKFCNTGCSSCDRNLMTSSVTAMLPPRSGHAHNVRCSVSLGATQQITTSSKPGSTRTGRHLSAIRSRVCLQR